jgi:hypothetical protein
VSQRPIKDMDKDLLRPITFLDALMRLHGMLGRHVAVQMNEYGCFFGCGFEGTLARVDSLPGSATGICVVLDGGAGLFLDPEDSQSYLVDGGEVFWLEFHRPVGPVLAIQAIDKPREGVGGATG